MKKKYFIVLGGGKDQLFLIKNIKKLNYKIILFDKNKKSQGFNYADLSFVIDFSNYKKVISQLEILKKEKIKFAGVITMGSDVPLIIHKIAKKFNLFHNNINSAKTSQDKILMKKMFKKLKIDSPDYKIASNKKDVTNFWKRQKSKYLIIKPSDSSGSRGVRIITSAKEINSAIANVQKNTRKKKFLVEELVEGPQLSTESIMVNKRIFTPAISYRNYEDVKYFFPQVLENGGLVSSKYLIYKKKIETVKKKISKELKINNGIIKGDFVIKNNSVIPIEFTTRLSGGDMSESLGPLSNGVNYVREAIKIAARQKVCIRDLKPKYFKYVTNKYFFLPPGNLTKISGVKKIKKIRGLKKIDFNYEINSKIQIINSHGKRVGVFVIADSNVNNVLKIVDKVYDTVKFKISGKWYHGRPEILKKRNTKLKTVNMM